MSGPATSPNMLLFFLFRDVKFRQRLLQVLKLGQIVDGDVRLVGMMLRVILVISFRGIKRLQCDNLSDNRLRENLGAIELIDVSLRDAALLVIGIENRRTILRAFIRPLPV